MADDMNDLNPDEPIGIFLSRELIESAPELTLTEAVTHILTGIHCWNEAYLHQRFSTPEHVMEYGMSLIALGIMMHEIEQMMERCQEKIPPEARADVMPEDW